MKTLFIIFAINIFHIKHVNAWKISKTIGPKVSGHTASSINNKLYLHGGLTESADSSVTNDFWLYENDTWNLIYPQYSQDTVPSQRMYAASGILNNAFYLIGGWDPESKSPIKAFNNDIWKYDLNTKLWTELPPMKNTLSRHTCCTVNDKIVIQSFGETLVLKNDEVYSQKTTGDAPNDLSLSCSAQIREYMVVVGGYDQQTEMSNSVYFLNTETWHWGKIILTDISPLAGACATEFTKNSILVFGGVSLSNKENNGRFDIISLDDAFILHAEQGFVDYSTIKTKYTPPGRVSATINRVGHDYILQGGSDIKDTFSLTYKLTKELIDF